MRFHEKSKNRGAACPNQQKYDMLNLVSNNSIDVREIDFMQLHRNGTLDSFIDDLQDLTISQQEAITKYKNRKFLAPIIAELQGKVDRWRMLIETGIAFKTKLQIPKRK